MPPGRLKPNVIFLPAQHSAGGSGTLIIRRALGDVLMLLPALAHWCDQRQIKVDFGTDSWLRPLVDRQAFIHQAFNFNEIADEKYKEIIMLERAVDFVPLEQRKHRTLLFADLLYEAWQNYESIKVGYSESDLQVEDYFRLTPYEKQDATDLLIRNGWDGEKKLVGIAPMTKSKYRNWGGEQDLIRNMPEINFVMMHNEEIIIDENHRNLINLSGKTNLIQLAAVCSLCNAAVLPDSGIMHVCGVLDVPTIAIFGKVIPSANRITFYEKMQAVESSCPLIDYCFDSQFANCGNTHHYRYCMNILKPNQIQFSLENILRGGRVVKYNVNQIYQQPNRSWQ